VVVGVGDQIRSNASVTRIERRRIVLSENGAPRELALDEQQEEGNRRVARPPPQRVPRNPARQPRRAARPSPGPPVANLADKLEQVGPDSFRIPKPDVENAIRNPASLFSQARILPKYEDGRMVGVQLNAIKEGSLFREIGIEDGDVITQLNGIEVDSPEQSARILAEFAQADEFDVTVQGADGSTRPLKFKLPAE
jgi:general secretion pathway protein C